MEIPVASKKSKTALDEGVPEGNGHQGKTIREAFLEVLTAFLGIFGAFSGVVVAFLGGLGGLFGPSWGPCWGSWGHVLRILRLIWDTF